MEKTNKKNNNFQIYQDRTLKEFQEGMFTIPVEEHIWYINNHKFYQNNWHHYLIDPWDFQLKNKLFLNFLKKSYFYSRIFLQFIKTSHLPYRIPNKNSIIFLGWRNKSYNDLKQLFSLFNKIKQKENLYAIILGKGDYEFNKKYVQEIPHNIKIIFTNNVNVSHPKIIYLPLGRDFRSSDLFAEIKPEFKKKYLGYCNFSLNTHPLRQKTFDSLKNKRFIEFEHMGNFKQYSISRLDFFEKLALSKFAICPRGKGIDTFRLWDSLYLGTIPIVVKEAVFHESIKDLPILFLDNYDDYANLTEDFLNETYQKFLEQKFDYRKLFMSFWLSQINKSLLDKN